MASTPLLVHLGEALIAAAWADGEVSPHEEDAILDLLFQMPDLKEEDWRYLHGLIQKPMDQAKRSQVFRNLSGSIKTEDDFAFAIYSMEMVMSADGVISMAEDAAFTEFIKRMQDAAAEQEQSLTDLLHEPLSRRIKITNGIQKLCPVRSHLDDTAAAFQDIAPRLHLDAGEVETLFLAGVLVGRVLRADDIEDARSRRAITDYLDRDWHLTPEQNDFFLGASLREELDDLDLLRISRLFYERTDETRRAALVALLFEVALANGILQEAEFDEIINIASNLKLDQVAVHETLMHATASGY